MENNTPPSAPPPIAPPPLEANAPVTTTIHSSSGGGLPKRLIFILLALVLLGIIGFVAFKLLSSGLGTTGGSVTVTWWGLWEEEAAVSSLITEYQNANPNVTIKYEKQSPQDYRDRLTNAFARGTGPDIFRIHNTWTPMFRSELEPMPSSVMSQGEFSQTFYRAATDDLVSGSSVLAMPLEFDTIALFINEEIFENYTKQPPANWDELRETAKELTIKDENGIIQQSGVALGITDNVDHWPEVLALLMLQNKVRLSTPTGPEAQEVLDFITRFSRVDQVWDKTLPSSTIAFAGGKVAMYFGPSWRVQEIKARNPDLRFRVVKVPQLRKQSPQDPDVYYATYWVEGVWGRSKVKEEAWKFLKFMSQPSSLEKFYKAASSVDPTRTFGEPYPRLDMQAMLTPDPEVGVFLLQAKDARTWYLAAHTFDGPTGINTSLAKYFGDAVNAVNNKEDPKTSLETAAQGVAQILAQYGLQ